jgi:hypothetical protein
VGVSRRPAMLLSEPCPTRSSQLREASIRRVWPETAVLGLRFHATTMQLQVVHYHDHGRDEMVKQHRPRMDHGSRGLRVAWLADVTW